MSQREKNCNPKNMTSHNQTIRLPKIFLTLSAEETTKGAFYNDFKKNLLNTKNGLNRFLYSIPADFMIKFPLNLQLFLLIVFQEFQD